MPALQANPSLSFCQTPARLPGQPFGVPAPADAARDDGDSAQGVSLPACSRRVGFR